MAGPQSKRAHRVELLLCSSKIECWRGRRSEAAATAAIRHHAVRRQPAAAERAVLHEPVLGLERTGWLSQRQSLKQMRPAPLLFDARGAMYHRAQSSTRLVLPAAAGTWACMM